MSRKQPGDRIGAILGSDKDTKTVEFLGFGTYAGDEVPPVPVGMVRMVGSTWDEIEAYYRTEMGLHYRGAPNPKLVLDSGLVVWGAEVWWDTEAGVNQRLDAARAQGYTVVEADMVASRKAAGYEMPPDAVA